MNADEPSTASSKASLEATRHEILQEIRQDPRFSLAGVKRKYGELYTDDKSIVTAALKTAPKHIVYASERLKNDREVILWVSNEICDRRFSVLKYVGKNFETTERLFWRLSGSLTTV